LSHRLRICSLCTLRYAQSVSALIDLAKSKPNQLNYASTGSGSAPHLAGELFKMLTGTSIVHVPYKGGTPALTDLIGGQVQMAFGNISNYLPQVRAGKIRALAVTSANRTPQAPELPTMIESGVAGFVMSTWFGIEVPSQTPEAIINRLNSTLNKSLAGEELQRRLAQEGADPIGGTPKEFAQFIDEELARWAKVIRAAKIAAE
jgi:tripartite-type tricarboxylate transporter receptor subunit TctC